MSRPGESIQTILFQLGDGDIMARDERWAGPEEHLRRIVTVAEAERLRQLADALIDEVSS